MVCIGSVSVDDGPKIFLLKDKIERCDYNDDFLVRHGLKPGSTIIMTDNASENHDAWF